MDETALMEPTAQSDAEYDAIIDRYLAEMERMKAQMIERERRIEHLRIETEVLLSSLKTG